MKNNDYLCEVMAVVGFAVVQLQRVEEAIAQCWFLYVRREHEPETVFVFDGDFEEISARNSKKVLGRFLDDITASGQFKKSIESRFAKFVNNRNRLIHRIFKQPSYWNIHNHSTLLRLHRFVSQLFKEAFFFESLFDAYLGVSYQLIADQQGDNFKGRTLLDKLMVAKQKSGDLERLRKAMNKFK